MLPPGHRLGPYEVESAIGAGGMGEVYKARDTRLDRPVALKVLNARTAGGEEAKRRFAVEARAISALNHPHIVTIYDIGSEDGIDYIAMEYIAGETLARRIHGQPLPLKAVLRYAIQIADALAAAHLEGTVHRDLKPANVMITARDEIKLLDFGLAKLCEHPVSEFEATLLIGPRTMAGVLVGTAEYMSPEQVEEKPVGPPADVFAFGVLLYEMLTGARPVQGSSKVAIMSAILHQEPPPVQAAAPEAPVELEHLVRLCLQKDPARRPPSMSEVRAALEGIRMFADSGLLSSPAQPAPPRRKPAWVAAGLLAAVALAGGAWWMGRGRRPAPPAARETVLTRLTYDAGFSGYPALSPDGKLMAYASDRSGEGHLDIWVQQTASGADAIRLTSGEVDSSEPTFSPDSAQVAFRSEREGGGIYVVRALGGPPRLIAPLGRRPRYSPDGKWILYWEGSTGMGFVPGAARVRVAPADGGTPRDLAPEFASSSNPVWTPDGGAVLFLGRRDANVEPPQVDWWIKPFSGGPAVATGAVAAFRARRLNPVPGDPAVLPGVYSGAGVLFAAKSGDSTNVWELPLDPKTGRMAGPPRPRTSGTNTEMHPSTAGDALAFASLTVTTGIWSARAGSQELQRITHGITLDGYPSLTADGRLMAFVSGRSGRPTVWLRDMRTGKESQVTAGVTAESQPKISGDGRTIAYIEDQPRPRKLMVATADAAGRFGTPRRLCDECGIPTGISNDGALLLLEDPRSHSPVLMDWRGGKRYDLIQAPERWHLYAGRLSHDSKWIAFHADLGGNPYARRIFVARLRPGFARLAMADCIPVTDGTSMDREAVWGPGDNLLYYLSERDGFRCIWARRLDPAGKQPRGDPFPVLHFHRIDRSLGSMPGSVAAVGLSVLPGELYFGLGEVSGNIWLQADQPR